VSLLPCRIMAANCPVSVTFAPDCITLTQAGDWTERQKRSVSRYLESEGFMEGRAEARLSFKRADAPK
jgi:hypothetical protein